jgi:hypothetical protein
MVQFVIRQGFSRFARIALCCGLVLPVVGVAQEQTECTLPDCDQAKAFFAEFQKAIDANQQQEVAGMLRYPFRSNRNGKSTMIKSKADLLARYDTVFDPPTRCAIKSASASDVWGNWRGFTVSTGVIWWDRIIPNSATHSGAIQPSDLNEYPFRVIRVNHSPETDKNCAGDAQVTPK